MSYATIVNPDFKFTKSLPKCSTIDTLVIHCAASETLTASQCHVSHKDIDEWADIGHYFYIHLVRTAVNMLCQQYIIDMPEYWCETFHQKKGLGQLLINMANAQKNNYGVISIYESSPEFCLRLLLEKGVLDNSQFPYWSENYLKVPHLDKLIKKTAALL